MSARINERTEYSWWCSECCVGSDYSDDDGLIEIEADQHDAEFHA